MYEQIKLQYKRCLRRKRCKAHFGDDDIILNNFRLNAIHIFPQKFGNNWGCKIKNKVILYDLFELDFYLDTKKDTYLLRLQDLPQDKIIFDCRYDFAYIIVQKRVSEDIPKELDMITKTLNSIAFPNYYENKIFEIEKWDF